jgi:hypothetical protein
MTETLRQAVGNALPAQVAWALLAALWNAVGVYLIAQGQRPLGPTATLIGAGLAVALAAGLVLSITRVPLVYVVLSGVAACMALVTAVGAFTQDPALWPSEFWRYAGAVLNGGGVLAGAAGCLAYFRWKQK